MLFALFVWGSLWFWLLPILSLIIICWCFEKDLNGGAIFTFFLCLGSLVLFTDVPVLAWIYENTWLTLIGIGTYFIGIASWMWIKWEFYTSAKVRKLVEIKQAFYNKHKLTIDVPIPGKLENNWNNVLKEEFGYKKLPLIAREHKAKLMAWGINWPINSVWTLVNDPIVRFTKWVYFRLSNLLDDRSKTKFDKVAVIFDGKATIESDDSSGGGMPWRRK